MNKSGIEMCGNRLLIKPDELEEKTKGGIVLPDQVKQRHEQAAVYGVIVDIGPDCWKHTTHITERYIDNKWVPFERRRVGYSGAFAEIGDRISFAIYSGKFATGEDGVVYKQINDEDVISKVSEKVTQTSIEARVAI